VFIRTQVPLVVLVARRNDGRKRSVSVLASAGSTFYRAVSVELVPDRKGRSATAETGILNHAKKRRVLSWVFLRKYAG